MSMDSDIPFLLSLVFVIGGFVLLAKSADMFVGAASSLARRFGISPLRVGMVIIGFGTSAPELAVSVMSGSSGHSNLSLGNAYGSCIFNILLIFGLSAVVRPLAVNSGLTGMINLLLMIPTGLLLILFMALNRRTCRMPRICGIVFLILYAGFLAFNVKTGISAA